VWWTLKTVIGCPLLAHPRSMPPEKMSRLPLFQQVDRFIAWNFFQDLRFLKSDEES
jgi:hypothetical protein